MESKHVMDSVEVITEVLKPFESQTYEAKMDDECSHSVNRITVVSDGDLIASTIGVYSTDGKSLFFDRIKDRIYNKVTKFEIPSGTFKVRVVNQDENNNLKFKITFFGDKL